MLTGAWARRKRRSLHMTEVIGPMQQAWVVDDAGLRKMGSFDKKMCRLSVMAENGIVAGLPQVVTGDSIAQMF